MTIRKTLLEDLNAVSDIYRHAREFMKRTGNPTQWGDSKPSEAKIISDIEHGNSYIVEENGAVCGVFSFIIGAEPTYERIDGRWLNSAPYGTIHRLASDGTKSGIFDECLEFCERKISNIRIDTHENNRIMRHLIEKNGFEFCGVIRVEDGSQRLAYQKIVRS